MRKQKQKSVAASRIGSVGFCGHAAFLETQGEAASPEHQKRMREGSRQHTVLAFLGDIQGLLLRLSGLFLLIGIIAAFFLFR